MVIIIVIFVYRGNSPMTSSLSCVRQTFRESDTIVADTVFVVFAKIFRYRYRYFFRSSIGIGIRYFLTISSQSIRYFSDKAIFATFPLLSAIFVGFFGNIHYFSRYFSRIYNCLKSTSM